MLVCRLAPADWPTNRCSWLLMQMIRGIEPLSFHVNCTRLAAAFLLTLYLATKTRTEPRQNRLVGHGGPVKSVMISSDGKYALTGSFDYSAIVWSLTEDNSKPIARLSDHDGAINAACFRPGDHQVVTSGDDGAVYLWDIEKKRQLHRFKGHAAKVTGLACAKNGILVASAGWDRTVRLWNLATLEAGPVLKGHRSPANAVLLSSDGAYVYSSASDGIINQWDARSGRLIRPVHRHGWGINVMHWMPGGKHILFGAVNGDVQILDPETGDVFKILIPHKNPVLGLAVSPKGDWIASGGGDGVIRVWRISDWSVVEELYTSIGPVWSMDFSADGRSIFYGGLDDYVTSWRVEPRDVGSEKLGDFPRRFQQYSNMGLGERQFYRKCSVCHTLKADGANRAGPTLYKIFGRRAGGLKDYHYSEGLKNADIIWNENTIDQLFALGPQHVTPGSKMPLQKIAERKKRIALIEFLKESTNETIGDTK